MPEWWKNTLFNEKEIHSSGQYSLSQFPLASDVGRHTCPQASVSPYATSPDKLAYHGTFDKQKRHSHAVSLGCVCKIKMACHSECFHSGKAVLFHAEETSLSPQIVLTKSVLIREIRGKRCFTLLFLSRSQCSSGDEESRILPSRNSNSRLFATLTSSRHLHLPASAGVSFGRVTMSQPARDHRHGAGDLPQQLLLSTVNAEYSAGDRRKAV